MPTRNTRDRATAMLPQLFYERLDEFGIDYAISYPTLGLTLGHLDDPYKRVPITRALNRYYAEVFSGLGERATPAAVVPMHTPSEAIAGLDHALALGLKVVIVPSWVERPVADPRHGDREPHWYDLYGLDSEWDYDPFWRHCVERGVAVTVHSPILGKGLHRSPSNYVFGHVGMFAEPHAALAKTLVLGGVTRRFPGLHFAFLEGGTAWAVALYNDLIGHWEKRGCGGIENLDPARLDLAQLTALFERYAGEHLQQHGAAAAASLGPLLASREDPATLDEFAAAGITRVEDWSERFARPLYFGCEGDDVMNALAWRGGFVPHAGRLNAVFGSDIGHWDVVEMNQVLEETWEQVEQERMAERDFRAFVFENAVRLHGGMNPDFFVGTPVERAARDVLESAPCA
jgi:hypothetical protein